MVDADAEEARFQKAVPKSNDAVNAFADYLLGLRKNGCQMEVEVKPAVPRPHFDERKKYGDQQDIRARWVTPGALWSRFEVKGLSAKFTCLADFPYKRFIVDRATKTSPICDWYAGLSDDLQYAWLIDGKTKDQWTTDEVYDRSKGYNELVWIAPLALGRFIKLETVATPEHALINWCLVCGAPAHFGHEVSMLKGIRGRWYCAEHDPKQ